MLWSDGVVIEMPSNGNTRPSISSAGCCTGETCQNFPPPFLSEGSTMNTARCCPVVRPNTDAAGHERSISHRRLRIPLYPQNNAPQNNTCLIRQRTDRPPTEGLSFSEDDLRYCGARLCTPGEVKVDIPLLSRLESQNSQTMSNPSFFNVFRTLDDILNPAYRQPAIPEDFFTLRTQNRNNGSSGSNNAAQRIYLRDTRHRPPPARNSTNLAEPTRSPSSFDFQPASAR